MQWARFAVLGKFEKKRFNMKDIEIWRDPPSNRQGRHRG
jgi:hypothetical protein